MLSWRAGCDGHTRRHSAAEAIASRGTGTSSWAEARTFRPPRSPLPARVRHTRIRVPPGHAQVTRVLPPGDLLVTKSLHVRSNLYLQMSAVAHSPVAKVPRGVAEPPQRRRCIEGIASAGRIDPVVEWRALRAQNIVRPLQALDIDRSQRGVSLQREPQVVGAGRQLGGPLVGRTSVYPSANM